MTPSMRAQAEIDRTDKSLRSAGENVSSRVYQAMLDAATKAAYDSAQYEIGKTERIKTDLRIAVQFADDAVNALTRIATKTEEDKAYGQTWDALTRCCNLIRSILKDWP